MNVEARITSVWKKRMILMVLFVCAAGMWFAYDGFIGWPAEAKRFAQYTAFVDGLVAEGKITRELADAPHNKSLEEEWRNYARSKGLGTSVPSDRKESDFKQQKGIAAGAIGIGLVILGWVILSCSRVLRADDTTITCPGGKKVLIDSVTGVNRKKWDNKGIAVLEYMENGSSQKAVLDDYKYGGAEEILLEVERRLAARSGE